MQQELGTMPQQLELKKQFYWCWSITSTMYLQGKFRNYELVKA